MTAATSERTVALGVGTQVMHDGRIWAVSERDHRSLLLTSTGIGAVLHRQVGVRDLLTTPGTSILTPAREDAQPQESLSLLLEQMQPHEIAAFEKRVAHVKQVLFGHPGGDVSGIEDVELPDDRYRVRPRQLMKRYKLKAEDLGIDVATVRGWCDRFLRHGEAGLIDGREVRKYIRPCDVVDPAWQRIAIEQLQGNTDESKPGKGDLFGRIDEAYAASTGLRASDAGSKRKRRAALDELERGRNVFSGSTKGKRENATRSPTPYGRLHATHPGQYVVFDTTRLDVFAMEPITCRWVNIELTVAMDLYSGVILGASMMPVSTKAVDVTDVFFEAAYPLPVAAEWLQCEPLPYAGLPSVLVVDASKLVDRRGRPLFPSAAPESVVIDHGKIYLSDHFRSVCQAFGVSIQPARVKKPTDKPVERFFRTVRTSFLNKLRGYKGPDVYSRGKDVEERAFYWLHELEYMFRQWVAEVYHRRPHRGKGKIVPEVPGLPMCPLDMFAAGVARVGHLTLPRDPYSLMQVFKPVFRRINHYGVEVNGLVYDVPRGEADFLGPYRRQRSGVTGAPEIAGKWAFYVNPRDPVHLWFQDPRSLQWQRLRWTQADKLDGPFNLEVLAYAKKLAAQDDRIPDVAAALRQLLRQWGEGEVADGLERRMALRLSAERDRLYGNSTDLAEWYEDLTQQPVAPVPEDPVPAAPADVEDEDLDPDIEPAEQLQLTEDEQEWDDDLYADALTTSWDEDERS